MALQTRRDFFKVKHFAALDGWVWVRVNQTSLVGPYMGFHYFKPEFSKIFKK
jgi:hypothetical protein